MKKCKVCEIEKEFTEFRLSKRHKDGYLNECRKCLSIKRREDYLNNYDIRRASNKKYYENNKEEIYLKIDKEKKRINDSKYYENNKIKISEIKKNYYENNKEEILDKRKIYYENNKEMINLPTDRKREIKKKSYKKRKYQYVWREILRKTITQLKLDKSQTTLDILGYDYDILKLNMESKFKEGMSWENHGDWHVDHIIPISLFKEGTHASIVNRLDNLRPLWSKDNLIRQNKIHELEDEYKYLLQDFKDYIFI
jgi:hypothetical protein